MRVATLHGLPNGVPLHHKQAGLQGMHVDHAMALWGVVIIAETVQPIIYANQL